MAQVFIRDLFLAYFSISTQRVWSVWLGFSYAFGKADLSASLMYSRTLFDSSGPDQSVDWISVRFVVCEILYGGLITANSDRDIVSALGRSLLDGRIYRDRYSIAPGLQMPSGIHSNKTEGTSQDDLAGEISEFLNYASNLPSIDNPLWYGLHVNAAFSSMQQRGIHLLRNIWSW